jgi:hypothetical protein
MYSGVHVTEMMGSSLGDWILSSFWLQPLVITFHHDPTAITHSLQSTIAHALGFSVSSSRLLATGLTTVTSTHCTTSLKVFICSHNSLIALSSTKLHWLTRYSLHHESYPWPTAVHLLNCLHRTNLLWHWTLHWLAHFQNSLNLRWMVNFYSLRALWADSLKTLLVTSLVLLHLVIHHYPASGHQHLPQKTIFHHCLTSPTQALYSITSSGVSRDLYTLLRNTLPRYYCARQVLERA